MLGGRRADRQYRQTHTDTHTATHTVTHRYRHAQAQVYLHIICEYGCGSGSLRHGATKAEIAHLDVAVGVQQEVGRLDIAMQQVWEEEGAIW